MAAVAQWRTHVAETRLASLANKYKVDMDDLIAAWNSIANLQLNATLTWLAPANSVGQFAVEVPVLDLETGKGEEDGTEKGDDSAHSSR